MLLSFCLICRLSILQRRRSMLPKLFGEEDIEKEKDESVDGDRSIDGSVSCEY